MIEEEIRVNWGQYLEKQKFCQHRWEETDFGKKYWAPGTWQYQCKRCGKTNMIQIGVDHEHKTN